MYKITKQPKKNGKASRHSIFVILLQTSSTHACCDGLFLKIRHIEVSHLYQTNTASTLSSFGLQWQLSRTTSCFSVAYIVAVLFLFSYSKSSKQENYSTIKFRGSRLQPFTTR